MKPHFFNFKQKIPISVAQGWEFFSSPANLSKITPTDMNFRIISDFSEDTKMYPGMIIAYTVSPIFNIRMNWLTEITAVQEHTYFIDEQRSGPFSFWHHEHHFEKIEGGLLMTDNLVYGVPLGPIGDIANKLLVASKVRQIFDFRKDKVEALFGKLN